MGIYTTRIGGFIFNQKKKTPWGHIRLPDSGDGHLPVFADYICVKCKNVGRDFKPCRR